MRVFGLLLGCVFLLSCVFEEKKHSDKKNTVSEVPIKKKIIVTDSLCRGIYKGVEFNMKMRTNGDIAHQHSNVMSKVVGDQLKKLFSEGKYSKVNFDKIEMKTKGMNNGDNYVVYDLTIPFIRVESKCDAMTSFDHCGGWGHAPAIEKRKAGFAEKGTAVMVGNVLDISDLKTTKEGLQEYWIQWKHVDYQSDCNEK
jgi:hypothetical protein